MFAAFGMIIVAIMLYQGMPELRQQKSGETLVLRSPSAQAEIQDLAALTERAIKLEQGGNTNAAMEAYEQALDRLATPMNNLAVLYLQTNRNREALALARVASDLRPFRAGILDTLARAYEGTGDHRAALGAEERAARLDPAYATRLDDLRKQEQR
jgi:tetratricopeptide (TPR) repeat protein